MEEKNLKISLDKAREWYNKGGELKELALSAFTEKEIKESALPNTWEEFCEMYPIKDDEWSLADDSFFERFSARTRHYRFHRNVLPSLEAAKAHLAYMQLHQLRDCYRQGWVPNWEDEVQYKWCIAFARNEYIVFNYRHCRGFLSFQSKEIAEKFLNNFKDLIETAGDLI